MTPNSIHLESFWKILAEDSILENCCHLEFIKEMPKEILSRPKLLYYNPTTSVKSGILCSKRAVCIHVPPPL